MEKCECNKYIINGHADLTANFNFEPENMDLVIYEVIRVINGVYLFLEDHLSRLFNSARLAGIKLGVDENQLKQHLYSLIYENNCNTGNVKIIFNFSGINKNWMIYFIPHYYPSEYEYNNGVNMVSFKCVRDNPNAKIWHGQIKDAVDKILQDRTIYEVALIDEDAFVSEGSRSNLFFIIDEKIITAPFEKVLPGITRKYVLQCCVKLKFDISEECLHYKLLSKVDSAFIAGTSSKVLPIKKIDHFNIPLPNKMTLNIMKEYDDMINDYILKNKFLNEPH